jgi:hypothetical protein
MQNSIVFRSNRESDAIKLQKSGSILTSYYYSGSIYPSDIGLKLDFANNQYWLGDSLLDAFVVDNTSRVISTQFEGNSTGLYLDITNLIYELGNNGKGFRLTLSNGITTIGDYQGSGNSTTLKIDDTNRRVSISGSTNITGSLTLTDVLVLPYNNPLPSSKPTGSIALSGSGATFVGMFMYNGTSWVKLSV